ncbi:uncharacterized protein LOC132263882 [Phlebotomus argentipes]|uniref:uncharacterized protein LOC132263882 n=1 Tax=Phlebotomus argentipes TaxID=94469 RepID=UPI00289334CC|nr:uncharacterized protein LOC132263882 [Phlebotomus argentipes]
MEETNPASEFRGLHSNLKLFGYGSGLLLSTFALIILLPLYYEQLALNGERFNITGAILFVSFLVMMVFVSVSIIFGSINKWKVPLYRSPIPLKRLLPIVLSFGVSVILFTVSCYHRVPCHLQDPLKGGALVFSLIFYFFFCRKVMGLQRIFSATTAVVGLFISVDYGLCDEFRCRGSDLTVTPGDEPTASAGWQGRAVWTLFYVIAIFVWAFHVVLLEGYVVSVPKNGKPNVASTTQTHLLRTVSRIVANSEPLLTSTPIKKPPSRQRVHPLHLIVWIHVLSFVFIVTFGWIDIFPATGRIKSFSRHLSDTENTLLCHLNIYNRVPDVRSNQEDVDFLSNLVPDSPQYNQTVQKLRRPRSADATAIPSQDRVKLNEPRGHEIDPGDFHKIFHVPTPKHVVAGINHTAHKINTERHWHKGKSVPVKKRHHEKGRNGTNVRSPNIVLELEISGDCGRCQLYSLLLVGVYIMFTVCFVNFLSVAESAVFTVTVVTATLPLVGIFWSVFKISKTSTMALLIWSPEISGEFICSLLGTPIVFLGLGLLFRAYVTENSPASVCETPSVSSLRNRYTSMP